MELSFAALTSRVRRALAREGRQLRSPRSARDRQNLGDFFIVDTRSNTVVAQHCTVEGLGHELGLIRAGEQLG
jgi:hypothetical protein